MKGGVIEIKAISSTSVVMNVCSDILVNNIVMPYACVGSGMSFIGVVDGHITIYLCLLNTLPR
ncbi:surface antigen family protein [Anaplasma phagocytophilum str. ApMUC09]|uniref:Surface antigen family protein n=1 Tax=Anaplasma phagocytophilum str. ApMUC09 TaxID=1359152 RepID=A0A0F3NBI6_ANAPH|nr:surface antigen family protein [Anaplasma phagocytophilum str. ApMUC09]